MAKEITHRTQYKVLAVLRDGPLGFTELWRKSGLPSKDTLNKFLRTFEGTYVLKKDRMYDITPEGIQRVEVLSRLLGAKVKGREQSTVVVANSAFAEFMTFDSKGLTSGAVSELKRLRLDLEDQYVQGAAAIIRREKGESFEPVPFYWKGSGAFVDVKKAHNPSGSDVNFQ